MMEINSGGEFEPLPWSTPKKAKKLCFVLESLLLVIFSLPTADPSKPVVDAVRVGSKSLITTVLVSAQSLCFELIRLAETA